MYSLQPVVPKGIRHSPTALEDGTLVLVINVKNFTMVPDDKSALDSSGFSETDVQAPVGAPGA